MFNCLFAKSRTMIHFGNTNKYSVLKITFSYLSGCFSCGKNLPNYARNVTLTRLNVIKVYLVYTYLVAQNKIYQRSPRECRLSSKLIHLPALLPSPLSLLVFLFSVWGLAICLLADGGGGGMIMTRTFFSKGDIKRGYLSILAQG